jgi:hypothetical protein
MVVLGLIACLTVARVEAKGDAESEGLGSQAVVTGPQIGSDGATPVGVGVEGARGKRGRRAGRPAAKATITIDGKDYVVSLIPVEGGKKGRKRARGAVVTLDGRKYRVRVVPADQAGRKGKKQTKAGKKGAERRKGDGKGGKRKKR